MKSFCTGIVVGIVFKKHIISILINILVFRLKFIDKLKRFSIKKEISISENNQITKVNFVCKVRNQDLFNESFNINKLLLNPEWVFLKENNVIQIQLDKDFIKQINKINSTISFNEIIDLKDKENVNLVTLDLPFFNSLGEVVLYFYYSINNKTFINVYRENDTLSSDDFKLQESTHINKFFDKLICASLTTNHVKNEYVTNYLKSFVNNKNKLTPEVIFYNYNKIPFNTDHNMIINCIINKSFIKIKSTELIE